MSKHGQSFNRHNSKLQFLGLLCTLQSTLVSCLSHPSLTRTFSRSVPLRHATARLMDSSLSVHVLQIPSFSHPHWEPFLDIKHYLLLLKITSNVKVASTASVPAFCRNCQLCHAYKKGKCTDIGLTKERAQPKADCPTVGCRFVAVVSPPSRPSHLSLFVPLPLSSCTTLQSHTYSGLEKKKDSLIS